MFHVEHHRRRPCAADRRPALKPSSPAKVARRQAAEESNPELDALVARTKEELARLDKKARIGERLEHLWRDGAYAVLNEEIFVPFEAEIVNCLKSPAFDIENKGQLYQFQASLKAINQIRERWERKIKEGADSRAQFLQIQQGTTPPGGV